MPIAIENGTSLNPQAPGAPPAATHEVNIPHHAQEGKLWCWAACIQMVLELKGTKMTQCEIVKTMLKDLDPGHQCPPDYQSGTESCDVMLMAKTWRACHMTVKPHTGIMKIEDIKTEIAANRAIEVGIDWTEGGGHAVLIKGWAETLPETLLIDDPLRDSPSESLVPASGLATHNELRHAFGHGAWHYTWSNLE